MSAPPSCLSPTTTCCLFLKRQKNWHAGLSRLGIPLAVLASHGCLAVGSNQSRARGKTQPGQEDQDTGTSCGGNLKADEEAIFSGEGISLGPPSQLHQERLCCLDPTTVINIPSWHTFLPTSTCHCVHDLLQMVVKTQSKANYLRLLF